MEGWVGSVGGVVKERERCVDIKEEVGEYCHWHCLVGFVIV